STVGRTLTSGGPPHERGPTAPETGGAADGRPGRTSRSDAGRGALAHGQGAPATHELALGELSVVVEVPQGGETGVQLVPCEAVVVVVPVLVDGGVQGARRHGLVVPEIHFVERRRVTEGH